MAYPTGYATYHQTVVGHIANPHNAHLVSPIYKANARRTQKSLILHHTKKGIKN